MQYRADNTACAAAIVALGTRSDRPVEEHVAELTSVEPYEPGALYRRELPAVRAVLKDVSDLALIVVDSYVDLDPSGTPGLGAHVHEAFGVPVIGVAKTVYKGATHAVPVHRGSAKRPLFVTAIGMDNSAAAAIVAGMAGQHRVPDLLRRVDRLARTGAVLA